MKGLEYGAYHAWIAADAEWSRQLCAAFGKNAGDVRYTVRGEGAPGTDLNKAYLAFVAGREEFERQ